MNAPSPAVSPPSSISSAAVTTVSSAAAVIASRTPERATSGKTRFSSSLPPTTTSAMKPMAFSASSADIPVAPAPPSANSGNSAISGIAARSWNSRIENAVRPCRAVSSFCSSSTCSAKAVDDSDRVRPISRAVRNGRPASTPSPASAAPVSATWAVPRPNTGTRMVHSRLGRNSRPMMNSSSTTPNSAKCRMVST
jgi:hypothetical protein